MTYLCNRDIWQLKGPEYTSYFCRIFFTGMNIQTRETALTFPSCAYVTDVDGTCYFIVKIHMSNKMHFQAGKVSIWSVWSPSASKWIFLIDSRSLNPEAPTKSHHFFFCLLLDAHLHLAKHIYPHIPPEINPPEQTSCASITWSLSLHATERKPDCWGVFFLLYNSIFSPPPARIFLLAVLARL